MGNEKSTNKGNNQNKTSQTGQTKRPKKGKFSTIQNEGNIKSDSINGNAIQYGDTIIYLSQNSTLATNDDNKIDDTKLDENTNINNNLPVYEPIIKLNKYNLKTKQMISSIEIDTSQYNIDILNCVYCLNTQNNSIYLINKNTQIFTISISDKPLITPLNFIDSENNVTEKPTKSNNIASIAYYNNTVIILGAIPKAANNEQKSQYQDNNVRYIPYDLTKMKQERLQLATTKFGKYCTIIEIGELQRMILMGGKTLWGKTDIYVPSNLVWECSIINKHKWNDGPLYLAEPMHSFGIIHLQLSEYRWLLLFGGTHVHTKKEQEAPMNSIYAIYFDKKYEQLTIKQLIDLDKKQNEKKLKKNKHKPITDLKLHGLWLELNVALPEKANYFAFYDENMDKDMIHLISRKSGNHYTINVEEVLQLLDKNKLFTKDGNDGTVHKCHPWTEAGKNPIPTKLAKLKGKGPKTKNKNKDKIIIGGKTDDSKDMQVKTVNVMGQEKNVNE